MEDPIETLQPSFAPKIIFLKCLVYSRVSVTTHGALFKSPVGPLSLWRAVFCQLKGKLDRVYCAHFPCRDRLRVWQTTGAVGRWVGSNLLGVARPSALLILGWSMVRREILRRVDGKLTERANGQRGGFARAERYSHQHIVEWGRRGGLKVRKLYGHNYFRKIRKLRKRYRKGYLTKTTKQRIQRELDEAARDGLITSFPLFK
jgi:hypothetical protein